MVSKVMLIIPDYLAMAAVEEKSYTFKTWTTMKALSFLWAAGPWHSQKRCKQGSSKHFFLCVPTFLHRGRTQEKLKRSQAALESKKITSDSSHPHHGPAAHPSVKKISKLRLSLVTIPHQNYICKGREMPQRLRVVVCTWNLSSWEARGFPGLSG